VDLARGKWQCMYKEERNFDTLHNSVGRMPAWCNEPSVHFACVCVCVCVCACRLPLLALWPRRKVQDSIRYPLNTNKLLLLESFWFTVSAAQLHTGGRGLSSTIRLWRGRVGPSQERRFRPARAHACRQGL